MREAGRIVAAAIAATTLAALGLAFPSSGLAASEEFTYTGAEQAFVVPAGVTSVNVVAIGSAGAASSTLDGATSQPGGQGARVAGTLAVTPGETLYVEVGGLGCNGSGVAAAQGGDGGGATDIREISVTDGGGVLCNPSYDGSSDYYQTDTSLNSRLIVAAGGGGGGYGFPGGAGGAAEQAGSGASAESRTAGGGGPGAAEQTFNGGEITGIGAGGGQGGSSGRYGVGGLSGASAGPPPVSGGGGGGGIFGGGGGAAWIVSGSLTRLGGGGGGGSNLVPTGGTETTTSEAAGVVISWTVTPASARVVKGTLASGTVANLAEDDDQLYTVNSTRSAKTAWQADFADVPEDADELTVTYRGSNSKRCVQTLSAFNFATGKLVVADKRRVGAAEKRIQTDLADLAGAPGDYVDAGKVRIRVSCRGESKFKARGEQLSLLDA